MSDPRYRYKVEVFSQRSRTDTEVLRKITQDIIDSKTKDGWTLSNTDRLNDSTGLLYFRKFPIDKKWEARLNKE